jgi:hypothetical protein
MLLGAVPRAAVNTPKNNVTTAARGTISNNILKISKNRISGALVAEALTTQRKRDNQALRLKPRISLHFLMRKITEFDFVLFLMILTKALLQLPLFYLGPLFVVVALTFAEATRRRLFGQHATRELLNPTQGEEGNRPIDSLRQTYNLAHHFCLGRRRDF